MQAEFDLSSNLLIVGHITAISADGRFVAFASGANNLVPDDTNKQPDIFVHDRQTGQTTRVSVDSSGAQANLSSNSPAISADGRVVAFVSLATNLASGDSNGEADVFVHDRQTGQTTRVNVDSSGAQANEFSGAPALNADGRFVAFSSYANNLVSGDTNNSFDIFVHDRQTGQTTRVSVDSSGNQGNGHSPSSLLDPPGLSADGRFVLFESWANNLVADDTNLLPDIFVHDRQTGITKLGGVDSSGVQPTTGSNAPLSLSADGRFVAFVSRSPLVPEDTDAALDIYVHDRQTGQTTLGLGQTSGHGSGLRIALSADGRFLALSSTSNSLVTGDTNVISDIFVHDRQTGKTTRVSVDSTGIQSNGVSLWPAISGNGRFVAFQSIASNLVEDDTNGLPDIFVHDRGNSTTRNPGTTDLDGNGTSDLLWRNTKTGSTAIWLLNGATIGSAGFPGGVPLAWQIAGIGDVNGDGKADVIWRHSISATVAIWLMNGTTITSVGFPASVPTTWSLQAIGDVNGDGQADLLWRNANDGNTAIWLMNGTKIATSGFLGKVPLTWQLAGVGDVDGESKADLIWRNGTSHAVAIWVMNGFTMTSSGFPGNASPDLQIEGVGDVNGDGKADLVWRNTSSGDVEVWLLNGATIASTGSLDGLSAQWQIAQVSDADGDGKADVIWYDTTSGAVRCWLLNGVSIASEAFPGTASPDWIIAGRPVPPPLNITTASTLPAGTVGQAYNVSIGITGGTPPISWSVFSGSLPPGLTLNSSTGKISGTPTTQGNFLFTVRVKDSGSPALAAQELFSLTINAPLPPTTGGGGGSLTISGAPAIVGGSFVPNTNVSVTKASPFAGLSLLIMESNVTHAKALNIISNFLTSEIGSGFINFVLATSSETGTWGCTGVSFPYFPVACQGVTINRSSGTITFSDSRMESFPGSDPPITLNGTLTFPPF